MSGRRLDLATDERIQKGDVYHVEGGAEHGGWDIVAGPEEAGHGCAEYELGYWERPSSAPSAVDALVEAAKEMIHTQVMVCGSDACEWRGPLSQCVTFPNDRTYFMCPECREAVEPGTSIDYSCLRAALEAYEKTR